MAEFKSVDILSKPPKARLKLPGSKSLTARALVASSLAHGQSRLTNALMADDIFVLSDALNCFGIEVTTKRENQSIEISGRAGRFREGYLDVNLAENGTGLRFMTALAALRQGHTRLDASPRLRRRPLAALIDVLRNMGAVIFCEEEEGFAPLHVRGGGLAGGEVSVDARMSSQFISALMLIAPCLVDNIGIRYSSVSLPYIEMTARVMADFGVRLSAEPGKLLLEPDEYSAREYQIEPDASTASFFWAAAAISGGRVLVSGLNRKSSQGDLHFLKLLRRMGAEIVEEENALGIQCGAELTGIDVDLSDHPDLAPPLAIAACFAKGVTRIRNAAQLRLKESDRISDLACELRKLGAVVEEMQDGMLISPKPPRAADIDPHNDHRLAMAFGVAALKVPGIRVANPACVGKSFPEFWSALETLRVENI